jgi:hypothetical protein
MTHIQLALARRSGSFYWMDDPNPHVIMVFMGNNGKTKAFHGHGDTRQAALLDLDMLLGRELGCRETDDEKY